VGAGGRGALLAGSKLRSIVSAVSLWHHSRVQLYIDFKLYPDYLDAYNSSTVYTIHGRCECSCG